MKGNSLLDTYEWSRQALRGISAIEKIDDHPFRSDEGFRGETDVKRGQEARETSEKRNSTVTLRETSRTPRSRKSIVSTGTILVFMTKRPMTMTIV